MKIQRAFVNGETITFITKDRAYIVTPETTKTIQRIKENQGKKHE